MVRRKYVAATLGILAAAAARVSFGQTIPPIIYDQFNYPTGDLNGQGLWSEKVANGIPIDSTLNLSYTGLNPSAIGAASLTGGSSGTNGEKMQTTFVGTPSNFGSIYFSLLVQVNSITSLPTASGEGSFFTGFNNVHTSSGLTNGAMLVRIRPDPSNLANYEFGVAKSTSTGTNVAWESDANSHTVTGQTALLVGKFTATGTGNTVQLWVNPTASSFGLSEAGAPTSTLSTSLGADVVADDFFLKASTNDGNMYADDARVGQTWASVAPIVWSNGGADNTWGTATNWYTGATPDAAGTTPSFLNVAGVSRTIHLAENRTVGGLIFNTPNISAGYTIDSTGGALTMDTLDTNTRIDSAQGNHTVSAPITLNKSLLATITADSVTLGGNVGGSVSIAKAGLGTLVLSGSNNFSGTTTINAGTLASTTVNSLPGFATTGQINVASGAALSVSAGGAGQFGDSDLAALISNGNFASGSKLAIKIDSGNTVNGTNITPAISLIEAGPGVLSLTGTGNFTNSTVSGGTLRFDTDAALGALPAPSSQTNNITLDGGTLQMGGNSAQLSNNRGITITAAGGTIDTQQYFTSGWGPNSAFGFNGGPLTKAGTGQFQYSGGNQNSYSALTLAGGTFSIIKADNLPSGAITFNGGALAVSAGYNTGNAVVVAAGGGTFNTKSNADVTDNGGYTGPGTLHKQGGSHLITNGIQIGGLSVDQGTVVVAQGRSAAKLSKLGTLSAASGAAMDLNDNDMILDYSGGANPAQSSAMQSLIKRGFANGAWTGDGLTSSQAAAQANSGHPTALGYSEASAVSSAIGGSFDGATLDSDMILVRYTYSGDANLDGSVDSNDFALLAANYGKTGKFWNAGDFNYDGTVNALDFNALATNYGQLESAALPDSAIPALGALVPEPTSITLLVSAGIMLQSRRRRFTN